MKMLTKYDAVIIAMVLILSICSYVFIGVAVSDNKPNIVEVTVDGKIYGSYRLTEAVIPRIIEINTEFGNNTLKVTHDGAEMIESDCRDGLDVKCGKITKVGQIIICIPNRVAVRLIGNSDKVDKVTY